MKELEKNQFYLLENLKPKKFVFLNSNIILSFLNLRRVKLYLMQKWK